MSTGMIVLALLGSMMIGVLIAILIDTFYVRRWHEEVQEDKGRLQKELNRVTLDLGILEGKQEDLQNQVEEAKEELEAAQKEATHLDEAKVELETRLETAVTNADELKTELKQIDDELDDLRDEKIELARQLTVAQIELKHLEEDLEADRKKLVTLDKLEAENQKLKTTLEVLQNERDERKAKNEELLNQLAETEKLRTSLKETEEKLQTSNSQLDNMQTALGRAKSQIKHTGKSQLQIIKGIGPATERKLKAAGIVTVPELAQQTPERVREILNLKPTSRVNPDAWITEAQQLAPTFGEEVE